MHNANHAHTWVVVANNCEATIYRLVKFPKIEEISHLEHPESKLHNQDLVSSRPGKGSQRGGNISYSYESETGPKHLEAVKFATYLGDYLSSAEQKKEFNRLYLFAETSFLGLLRPHINAATKKTVVVEVPKDLMKSDIHLIEKHLADL
ncbi:MAG: host attachment protein [Parachlamydiaceae bacterium]